MYIQGGESSFSSSPDGTISITVRDIIPYINVNDDNRSTLMPVTILSNLSSPKEAAFVFSEAGNESVSMVKISNLSLSADNTILTLQVTPEKYSEGTVFKSFAEKNVDLDTITGEKFNASGIYLALTAKCPVNSYSDQDICYCRCMQIGGILRTCGMSCYGVASGFDIPSCT